MSYDVLKYHFDKIIFGGYPSNSSLNPIRDTFELAFGTQINLYEIVQSTLRTNTNKIGGIVTLVGPEPEEDEIIPSGLMGAGSSLVSVNILNEDIYKGLYENTIVDYIDNVFDAMYNIIQFDSFFVNNSIARNNPHCIYIKAAPVYYTFHHLAEVAPNYIDKCENLFKEKIEKYMMLSTEDANIIYENLVNSKYSENENKIYNVMTNGNTIIL